MGQAQTWQLSPGGEVMGAALSALRWIFGAREPEPWTPPKAYEWYVDGAKWLIGVAAAVIAFGLTWLKDTPDRLALDLFLPGAALLFLAAVAAMYYIWHSYFYAALLETGRSESESDVAKLGELRDFLFNAMLWCFALGMAVFAFSAATQGYAIATLPARDSLQIAPAGVGARPAILAYAQREGRLWALESRPDGSLWWRPLRPPPR